MGFREYKEIRDAVRREWKALWRTRIDDKLRAEGISSEDFSLLFTHRGDIIYATRDYKPLSFHKILEKHLPKDVVDSVNPSPVVGGIRKFIREMLSKNQVERRKDPFIEKSSKKRPGPLKQGGRGWLHMDLGLRKK